MLLDDVLCWWRSLQRAFPTHSVLVVAAAAQTTSWTDRGERRGSAVEVHLVSCIVRLHLHTPHTQAAHVMDTSCGKSHGYSGSNIGNKAYIGSTGNRTQYTACASTHFGCEGSKKQCEFSAVFKVDGNNGVSFMQAVTFLWMSSSQ